MRRARLAVAVGAATLAVATSGCEAGQSAMTSHEFSVKDGRDATVGKVDVQDVIAAYPAGGSYPTGSTVTVSGRLLNRAASEDGLVAATTPTGTAHILVSAQLTPSPSAAGSSTASAAPTEGTVLLPRGQLIAFSLAVADTTKLLRSGDTFRLTLTFGNAGTVTVAVPVATPDASNLTDTSASPSAG